MSQEHSTQQGEPTLGQLATQLSEQTSRLVRDEMRLAQAELKEKGKHAGIGIGMFSGAGLLAFFGAATLIATAVLALALVLPAWAAALIVAVVLFVLAAVLGLVGKKEVEQATPAKPERAAASVQRDVTEIKEHGQR